MVRHYKKKKSVQYDQDTLLLAIKTVVMGGKSIHGTAKAFHIPCQTLRKHVLQPSLKIGSGVKPVLSVVEEDHLAHGLVYLSECGVPQGRRVLKEMVASFLKGEKRPNPFKGNIPGKDWIKG